MAGLVLAGEHGEGCPRDVRTGPGIDPGEIVNAILDAQAHQIMPGGVKLDLITPIAVTIVSMEHGRIFIGEDAPTHRLGSSEFAAELRNLCTRPACAFASHAFAQGAVGSK